VEDKVESLCDVHCGWHVVCLFDLYSIEKDRKVFQFYFFTLSTFEKGGAKSGEEVGSKVG